jgi:flagellar hook-associated protein 1 FlgK
VQTQLQDQIGQDNQLVQQVAHLNQAIETAQVAGESPNALLDQRSGLLTQLAKDLGAVVTPVAVLNSQGEPVTTPGGTPVETIQVSLPQGTVLVSGSQAGSLAVTAGPPWGLAVTAPGASAATTVSALPTGTAGGLLALLNGPLSGDGAGAAANSWLNQLDQVAAQLADQVNQFQTASSAYYIANPATMQMAPSSSSNPLFVSANGAGVSAQTLAVSAQMIQNPYQLAAATSANANNGDNATAMADLQNSPSGPLALWDQQLSQFGTQVQQAQQNHQTQSALAAQAQQAWQSVSGVNVNKK